jgi:hypothetical protein
MIAVGALNEFLSEAIEDNPVDIFSPGLFQAHRLRSYFGSARPSHEDNEANARRALLRSPPLL